MHTLSTCSASDESIGESVTYNTVVHLCVTGTQYVTAQPGTGSVSTSLCVDTEPDTQIHCYEGEYSSAHSSGCPVIETDGI